MSNDAKQLHTQAVEKIKQFVAYAIEAQDARLHALAWRMSRRLDGRRPADWGAFHPGRSLGAGAPDDTSCGSFSVTFDSGSLTSPASFYVWDEKGDAHVAAFFIRERATAQLQVEELDRVHALAVSVAQSLDSAKSAE